MTRHDDGGPTEDRIPSEAELAAAQDHLNSALAHHGISLDDPALWLGPRADVPLHMETAIAAESAPPVLPHRRVWRWVAVAAALIGIIGVAAFITRSQPDWSIALGPTDDFPLASAVIDGWNEGSGTRMLVDIAGVDPAPEGFFYEMWMSEGPVHVSAGTFVETTDVHLRAAVSRRDYPRLWVTLEPIDDDESPTTVVVIDTG